MLQLGQLLSKNPILSHLLMVMMRFKPLLTHLLEILPRNPTGMSTAGPTTEQTSLLKKLVLMRTELGLLHV